MELISGGIYAVAALGVIFGTAYFTNKRMNVSQLTDVAENNSYKMRGMQLVVLIVLILISGVCGYKIGNHTNSVSAVIKIGCCYFAVLGAAVVDYKLKIIPNFIPLSLIILRLLFLLYEFIYLETVVGFFLSSTIGCLISFLFLGFANKLSKGGIGAGDIKLLVSIGFMSDIYIVMKTLMLALLACIVISSILLVLKKCTLKDHLPFGPFIYAGFVGMCLLTL